ncbi:hypothetical protein GLOIN_2v1771484 [Rhizophagus irregularis DAOM 181602=DAOM 197198]|uniref:BTB domain-containing protein n=1 Tax=Rhizophagus irregularis (strain DAOM 181602 / DAOM 197198 / MUCL 43194) TaxID=747089 RepID=A0A2P4Q9F8_RHIID|nr:hypothetical protein GLOIN_2v1771484 [Rhizophagus irregularis DAOM 181602=DAOM 197198]POG74271.1 hypothetical protein GLOIN_2v1771484 [Rhizophagus irregularis DAOM 181602=DAOM 197198]|eukprot:XP_025181137.1 hypothetical protein GLOIN_2v1771484 [Rhizophagus irregularis DAOM 181602=DAOM 197198]
MTRHHNKKSFLSQTKYDIQMRARAIEHRRKTTMYGHAQGKIIGEDTMYGNAQGKIGEDREDTIYDDDEYYDITVEVGNDLNVRIFRAHMVILKYHSSYLQRIRPIKKLIRTLTSIKLPNILPETFQIVLRYIYGGKFLCMTNFSLFDPYYP